MARNDRLRLIEEIEQQRNTRVLCYLTGDRQGLETKIGTDVFSLIYDHLMAVGYVKALDLFLYSTGGLTMAGWGLVNLFRRFCETFTVIVPFKAHSCATLITLGADEILMGKLGQLSPVDPSVNSPYNPPAPGQFPSGVPPLLPVNVEDAIGYLQLAQGEANLKGEAELKDVFLKLSEEIHPLALGGVYRAREQIRMVAEKLLRFHMGTGKEHQSKEIEGIVDVLTKQLLSHDYILGREEAKDDVGLKVTFADEPTEKLIWDLFKCYESEMDLNVPYNPDKMLGTDDHRKMVFHRAFIESQDLTDCFVTERDLRRVQVTQPGFPSPVEQVKSRTIRDGWIRIFPEDAKDE